MTGVRKSNGDAYRLLRLSESGMKARRETESGDGGQHPNNPAKAIRHWRSSFNRNTVEGRDAAGYEDCLTEVAAPGKPKSPYGMLTTGPSWN